MPEQETLSTFKKAMKKVKVCPDEYEINKLFTTISTVKKIILTLIFVLEFTEPQYFGFQKY